MLQIKKLYSYPEIFDAIEFERGVNFILGEPSEDSAKTNGVGKSVAIEFMNFALLNNYAGSRVKKVPESICPLDTVISIDLWINEETVTVHRCPGTQNQPTIVAKEKRHEFQNIEDARSFLESIVFTKTDNERPSFRSLLSILMRDERSEFKSIVNGFDTATKIPDDYSAHLYLLGIKVEIYRRVRTLQKEVSRLKSKISDFQKSVEMLRDKKLDEARADLNELDSEVALIERDIENLENFESSDALQTEIQNLDNRISDKRRAAAILMNKLSQLEPVEREKLQISTEELTEYYNDLKEGLGDLVSRDLNELKSFKEKVYRFQDDVLQKRRTSLEQELTQIKSELRILDKEYQKKLRQLDQGGALRTLKQAFANYQEKSDQLADLRSFIHGYDTADTARREKNVEKDTEVLRLQSNIDRIEVEVRSFEETILSIHNFVMGNRQASFTINTVEKAQVIEIVLRIDSDGSHSVDREKTFIYDFSLLINENTSKRHLGFLVHDNLFDVDTDTLKRSLKFILNQQDKLKGQYIVTLNSDRISSDAPDLMKELNKLVRARFTKANRFLKRKYQQL